MLGHMARVAQDSPTDHQRGLAGSTASGGQGRQKGVGGGVAGLSRVAQNAGDRGIHDKKFQGQTAAGLVQIPGPETFRPDGGAEVFRISIGQRGALIARGRMDDPPQRRHGCAKFFEQGRHLARVRNVGGENPGFDAGRTPAREGRVRLRARCAGSSHQGNTAGPVRDEPLGRSQAEAAHAAGHKVGRIVTERWSARCGACVSRGRNLEDQLANVFALRELAQGVRCLGERTCKAGQGAQLTGLHQARNLTEQPLRRGRVVLENLRHVDGRK